jgi:uncharacterized sulfatase
LIPEPLLATREKKLGSRYAILRQADGDAVNKRLGAVSFAASEGVTALPQLVAAMTDSDAAIRYWGATGVGNIGAPAKADAEAAMRKALADEAAVVRIAAARALCRMGEPKAALPVLIKELKSGSQWERVHAAIALDEIDEQAKPVIEDMRAGLKYQKGFLADGKYRVRVINRALNELEGTSNRVK